MNTKQSVWKWLALFTMSWTWSGCSIQYADPYYGYHDEEKTFRSEGFIATMNQGGPFVRHPKKSPRWKDLPAYSTTRCASETNQSRRTLATIRKLKNDINQALPSLQSQWRGSNRLQLEIPQHSIFLVDAPHLKPEAYPTLNTLVAVVEAAGLRVDFVGHADSTGTMEYNQSLSTLRALHLQRYFVLKGLPQYRTNSYGLGETAPIADNSTAIGREKNRRVSMIFCTIER